MTSNISTVALVVAAPKADFALTPIVLDTVRDDEVETRYSGICHTDIVLQQGLLPMVQFPAIFGHEGAGIVKAVGAAVKDKSLSVGDAVLLSLQHVVTARLLLEVNLPAATTTRKSTTALFD